MKTLLPVMVAFVLGALATAAGAQVKQAPSVGPPEFFETHAFYLRDVSGRCLRVQPQIRNGQMVVLAVPPHICAKEEAGRR